MRLSEHFLKNALPEISFVSEIFPDFAHFSTDTRTLQQGDIFIALEGPHFDGHTFLQEALEKGAVGLFIAASKKEYLKNIDQNILKKICVALVPHTRNALITLATAWRAQFTYPVIGITGSVGKTSTRERITTILDHNKTNYIATQGNQNNSIGVALNVLRMRSEHEIAVFELGINKRGEMAQLVSIARPTTAIITCIGHAHMEGLGSIIDIAAEKRDIFSLFKEDNIGIINGDQLLLSTIAYRHPVIKFGSKTTNQIQARKIRIESDHTSFILKLYHEKYKIDLPSNHSGAVFNALAAITIAHHLGIPTPIILQAIQKKFVVERRFEQLPLKAGKGVVIDDCYNASPESMKAALLALQKLETRAQKFAILGDMLELGVNSPFWHRQLGRFLRKVPTLKKVYLVGNLVEWTKKTVPVGLAVEHVATWQDALTMVKADLKDEAVVLVKGSNGVGLGNLVDAMTQESA